MDYQTDPMHDLDNQPPGHLQTPGRKPISSKKKPIIIIAVIVAVGILLSAAFVFFFLGKSEEKSKTNTSNQQEQMEEEEPTLPPSEAAQPQAYKSETLNIEITHRKDWTVKEAADKKQLTLTSPKFTYQNNDGESAKGVFTVKFSLGTTEESQATIDAAKSVRDSVLIGYDAPTEAQRHYTNVTYAGPDQATFKFFVVTGSTALKPDTPLAGTVVINSADFLIAGGFGADSQNALNFDTIPAADIDQYTVVEQAIAIVKSLKVF